MEVRFRFRMESPVAVPTTESLKLTVHVLVLLVSLELLEEESFRRSEPNSSILDRGTDSGFKRGDKDSHLSHSARHLVSMIFLRPLKSRGSAIDREI